MEKSEPTSVSSPHFGKKHVNLFIYLFISFLFTINLKLIIVHVEIKIVNKEAATKRSTLLHAQRHACIACQLIVKYSIYLEVVNRDSLKEKSSSIKSSVL